jgi:hypothetical protein
LQNFSFATATAEKRGFAARGAKNRKSLWQKQPAFATGSFIWKY